MDLLLNLYAIRQYVQEGLRVTPSSSVYAPNK